MKKIRRFVIKAAVSRYVRMNEIWRSVKDYEGLYEVSNWGRVRNILTHRMLKFEINAGYYRLVLVKNKIKTHKLVHRLVAQAFIPNPLNLPQVNHIDENKLNNCVENLEWCTAKYNNVYRGRIERMVKTKSKTVYMLTLNGGLCGMWPSTQECTRNGFSGGDIIECCNGKRNQHKGFKWSYNPPKPPKALPYYIT